MTFKKASSVVLFRITLFASVILTASLVLLALTAVQVGKVGENFKVVAQFFPTGKNYFTLHEFKQLNTIAPIEKGDRALVAEMLARHYLEMRYEQIQDVREMTFRWGIGGPVYTLSTPAIYNKFAEGLEKKLDDLPEVIITIHINNVVPQMNGFSIDFTIWEHLPNGQRRIKGEKNVILEYRYGLGRAAWDPQLLNPYRLIFIRYEETDRKTGSRLKKE